MSSSSSTGDPTIQPITLRTRKEFALPALLLGGAIIVGAVTLLATALTYLGRMDGQTYAAWIGSIPRDVVARVQWVLGDITEPQFYKSWIGSIGLLLGAAFAWLAQRKRLRFVGSPIAYGSGLWPWMLAAASLSLLLSNAVFGSALAVGWQPTFVPFVCVATAVVLVYGRGWKVALTGAILGAFTTPLSMLLIAGITSPLGLPSVIANTTAMSIGAAVVFLLARILPWMRIPTKSETEYEEVEPQSTIAQPAHTFISDTSWMVRRVLKDFTETQFWATEWATIGLLVGVSLHVALAAGIPSYGTELLPKILVSQALTSAIGIIIWRRLYRGGGWAPTYISVVSVAPATVLAYNGSIVALILGAIAGAILCPLVARPISARLPADFHPFIGNTIAMAVVTTIVVPVVGLIV